MHSQNGGISTARCTIDTSNLIGGADWGEPIAWTHRVVFQVFAPIKFARSKRNGCRFSIFLLTENWKCRRDTWSQLVVLIVSVVCFDYIFVWLFIWFVFLLVWLIDLNVCLIVCLIDLHFCLVVGLVCIFDWLFVWCAFLFGCLFGLYFCLVVSLVCIFVWLIVWFVFLFGWLFGLHFRLFVCLFDFHFYLIVCLVCHHLLRVRVCHHLRVCRVRAYYHLCVRVSFVWVSFSFVWVSSCVWVCHLNVGEISPAMINVCQNWIILVPLCPFLLVDCVTKNLFVLCHTLTHPCMPLCVPIHLPTCVHVFLCTIE